MNYTLINDEKCCEIDGFDRYLISESGRIYRVKTKNVESVLTEDKPFISENKIHFRARTNAISQGFASLTDNNGKLRNVAVPTLVAKAFGLISGKLKRNEAIGYKDNNKKNIHYTNLIIVEKKAALQKLSIEDVAQIRKLIKQGMPLNKIGKLFNVSEMQINRIKTGENWGNGKRKIKAPEAPFEIKDGRMRKYVATFNCEKTREDIRKKFTVRRNPENPIDNTITGIVNGYRLTLEHKNITRAKQMAEKLNSYFFEHQTA